MRAVGIGLIALALVLAGFFASRQFFDEPLPASRLSRDGVIVGQPRPGFKLGSSTGEIVSAADFDGRVLLINFWATWCEPCKAEMPRLERLYRERAGDGLRIVGVLRNDEADDETLRAFLEQMDISYTVVRPRQRYVGAWAGTSVLPTSFLLGGDGYIRRRYVGAAPEQIDGLIYDLEAALDGRPLGPYIVAETPNAVTEPPPEPRDD